MNRDVECRAYFEKVGLALAVCQQVEEELKRYITMSLELASKLIGNEMTFRFTGEDYQDRSLERLIDAFRKLCGNDPLRERLDKFRHDRNFVSHQSIVRCMNPDGDLEFSAEDRQRLEQIRLSGDKLVEDIGQECARIGVRLWFDDLTKEGSPESQTKHNPQ